MTRHVAAATAALQTRPSSGPSHIRNAAGTRTGSHGSHSKASSASGATDRTAGPDERADARAGDDRHASQAASGSAATRASAVAFTTASVPAEIQTDAATAAPDGGTADARRRRIGWSSALPGEPHDRAAEGQIRVRQHYRLDRQRRRERGVDRRRRHCRGRPRSPRPRRRRASAASRARPQGAGTAWRACTDTRPTSSPAPCKQRRQAATWCSDALRC